MPKKILVLAGTYEARKLIAEISAIPNLDIVASYAGVTKNPVKLRSQTRFGGFGGVEGLIDYLESEHINFIIDATHPFSEQIKLHASQASIQSGIPLAHFIRSHWVPETKEKWNIVNSIDNAIKVLPANSRPFFAIGKKHAHKVNQRKDIFSTIRTIEMPDTPFALTHGELILARATKNWEAERDLFKKKEITHLILRNSGGEIGYAKIIAARQLNIPIIMIERPPLPKGKVFTDLKELKKWLIKNLKNP